ncbi:flagellar hook-length control protein [Mycobacterium sp. 4D054]|uniref:flagellar hook-length control protein n=1 Tax=Mycobacterium sp. 4D054 TaxID=3457440 RepID=UPI003FCF9E40
MSSTTKSDGITAAMSIAEDIAAGTVEPTTLESELADECRALFGVVAGPADPLWPLHVDITRQALAAGALSADELSEWAAVIRRREAVGAVDASETPEGTEA